MRHSFVTFMTAACILTMGSMAFAMEKHGLGKNAIQHKEDARDTMSELSRRGQEKVDQAKGEARKPDPIEEIQTRSKEDINNKIDDMKERTMGR